MKTVNCVPIPETVYAETHEARANALVCEITEPIHIQPEFPKSKTPAQELIGYLRQVEHLRTYYESLSMKNALLERKLNSERKIEQAAKEEYKRTQEYYLRFASSIA